MKRYKNNKKYIIKWLTSNPKWVIIKPKKGGKQVSKQKKSGKKDIQLETIILLTAITNLIEALIELIRKLI